LYELQLDVSLYIVVAFGFGKLKLYVWVLASLYCAVGLAWAPFCGGCALWSVGFGFGFGFGRFWCWLGMSERERGREQANRVRRSGYFL